MGTIRFYELTPVPWFRKRRIMKTLLVDLFRKEKTLLGEISYIFCSDEYLLEINRQFLNHDDYTDIITFDLTDSSNSGFIPGRKGEIYISIDRVVDNAKTLGLSRQDELHRVMIHGCLHLCGYKDKLNEQKALMRKKEDQYLSLYKRRST